MVQTPVNTTECREVQKNKCRAVTKPVTEQECKQLITKNCRKITEKVTEIVNEVSESIQLILKSIFLSNNIQPILQGSFFLVNPNNKSGLVCSFCSRINCRLSVRRLNRKSVVR